MKEPVTYRGLSLDPGGNLGVTIFEMDVRHTKMKVLHTETIDLNREVSNNYPLLEESCGKRFARAFALRKVVLQILKHWQVDVLVHESAFFQKFRLLAGAVLTEYLVYIRFAALEYDPCLLVQPYSPMEVKRSVGAKKLNSDKDLIKKALPALKDLDFGEVDLDLLDEHGIDSIAIGYCYFDKNRL